MAEPLPHEKGLEKKGRQLAAVGPSGFWWRFTDSNRGPVDYDSIALTD
jgi:hypothetical protein